MTKGNDWDMDLEHTAAGEALPFSVSMDAVPLQETPACSADEIAASMEEFLRDVEAQWNKNLETPISLDSDVKLYTPPAKAPAAPPVAPTAAPATASTMRWSEEEMESWADLTQEVLLEDTAELDLEAALQEAQADRLPSFLKVLLYLVCVVLAAVLLALGAWLAAEDVLALTKPDRTVTITISAEDSIEDIAQTLYDNNLIEYKSLFKLYAWFAGAEDSISAGEYTLNNQYDYHALVSGMYSGYTLPDTVTVTIPEGYECADIFALLEDNGVCDAESLAQTAATYEFSYDFLQDLPYGESNRLEGYLFPDTYEFYVDDDPENVLDRFLSNFETKFDDDMMAQLEVLNNSIREKLAGKSEEEIAEQLMTVEKIVILASLIEKEAAVSSERTTIASVIYNRLLSDLYPNLEIDATIQYVLEERKDVLTYSDLEIDSLYNTYLYSGLPVGAICNPGLSCLKAALYPAETDYYYYALNTDGVHTFFENAIAHQAFVNSTDYAGASEDTE